MSDETPQQTYTARDIVLEFFPATHERLVPQTKRFQLSAHREGSLLFQNLEQDTNITLEPIAPAGEPTTQVCCAACERSMARHYSQMYRAEVPGSKGRRFRYVTLCRNQNSCALHRLGEQALEQVWKHIYGA